MNNVSLITSFSLLFSGIIAGDKISPVRDEVSKREGESVTLKCEYETTYSSLALYWYRHHSDLQAPQFILWKGARGASSDEYIPDKQRYESITTVSSTELTIKTLTLADTGLYYCRREVVFKPQLPIRWILIIPVLSESLWLQLLM
uniref:Ig-like domain-containing protein n=1 Tax=Sander lucioperca TaxID=283035 RepID=A0A8D0AWP8_SANLU